MRAYPIEGDCIFCKKSQGLTVCMAMSDMFYVLCERCAATGPTKRTFRTAVNAWKKAGK